MAQAVPNPPPGFEQLSVDEKIEYVESLWDRIVPRRRFQSQIGTVSFSTDPLPCAGFNTDSCNKQYALDTDPRGLMLGGRTASPPG